MFVILLLALFSPAVLGEVRYDNFQVLKITPKTEDAVNFLRGLAESNSGYDFWTEVRGIGYSVDIMVPPNLKSQLSSMVDNGAIDSRIFIADVQKLIDIERPKIRPRATNLEWTDYHTLEEINQFLIDLDAEFDSVTLVDVGTSYENRKINGVKVSFTPGLEKRTVFIESNIHAREWITSAVSTWILNEILRNTTETVLDSVTNYDWIFVPVFNPDGFEYTHTEDRMWRKTRTPYFFCHGADPNRNWGYQYNEGGTSAFSCSSTYRGPHAFSERSTSTISEYITSVASELRAYISFHSYSQMLLLPYGTSERPDNFNNLLNIGNIAAETLKSVHGTEYTVGNIVDILYVASGGSMDWVKGTFGTPITYTYELRDKGEYGFILPPEQIIPTAEETFASLLKILEEFDKIL